MYVDVLASLVSEMSTLVWIDAEMFISIDIRLMCENALTWQYTSNDNQNSLQQMNLSLLTSNIRKHMYANDRREHETQ